mmetsp:Transcript_17026/g.28274  ORF Transcript_17026/g.28274 Transcript_17026/m.28274 type:complete len:470 (-) Transcript_17026:96-1505(-)
MAAFNRPTEATYEIHDEISVETSDNEDHTFCGIMFPVKCKDNVPVEHVVINSIAVRGQLGPLTVWVSKEEQTGNRRQFRMNPRYWTKVYEKTHAPSFHTFKVLDLSENPIRMKPGQIKAVYIHSTRTGDEAIVYDNRRQRRTYDDALVSILTGRAHVSERAFGTTPIWGWGNPWRDQREFVGRIEYGAVYKLWNPASAPSFGVNFQNMARSLFLCQRRWASPLSMLPDDCIFYIINMCRWDWADDSPDDMKALKKRRTARAAAAEARRQEAEAVAEAAAAPAEPAVATSREREDADTDTKPAASKCCNRRCDQTEDDTNDDSDEDFHNDEEDGSDDSDVEFHNAQEEADQSSSDDDIEDDDDDDDDGSDDNEGNIGLLLGGGDDDDGIEDDDDDDDEDEDDDDEDWEDNDGYNADSTIFRYRDDSEDEEEDDGQDHLRNRQAWIRRQFARIHVLQALAAVDDNGGMESA